MYQTPNNNNTNKIDKKTLMIIGGVAAIVIILLILYFTGVIGGKKNTTGMSGYKRSHIDYNCVYTDELSYAKITEYMDLLINEPDEDDYENIVYYVKEEFTFDEEISDYFYVNFVELLDSSECDDEDFEDGGKCTKNNIKLGSTNVGDNTTIKREKKKIILTGSNSLAYGHLEDDEIEDFMASLKDSGYTCK